MKPELWMFRFKQLTACCFVPPEVAANYMEQGLTPEMAALSVRYNEIDLQTEIENDVNR